MKAAKPVNSNDVAAVLFDLDGTLVDTAPDLIAALNLSLTEHNLNPVEFEPLRQVASDGSMALATAGCNTQSQFSRLTPENQQQQIKKVQQGLLRHYQQVNGAHSVLFDGILPLLSLLDRYQLPYGIITNKPARYTRPLVSALKLTQKMGCVISGDSTHFSKPDLAPMLLGAQQLGVNCEQILYLGDAKRDLLAADNTMMMGGIALWGYISDGENIAQWPHHFQFDSPHDVMRLIEKK